MEVWSNRAKAPVGDRQPFRGTATQVIADIREYQTLGVTHFVFDFTEPNLNKIFASMERFADQVRPKVRRAP